MVISFTFLELTWRSKRQPELCQLGVGRRRAVFMSREGSPIATFAIRGPICAFPCIHSISMYIPLSIISWVTLPQDSISRLNSWTIVSILLWIFWLWPVFVSSEASKSEPEFGVYVVPLASTSWTVDSEWILKTDNFNEAHVHKLSDAWIINLTFRHLNSLELHSIIIQMQGLGSSRGHELISWIWLAFDHGPKRNFWDPKSIEDFLVVPRVPTDAPTSPCKWDRFDRFRVPLTTVPVSYDLGLFLIGSHVLLLELPMPKFQPFVVHPSQPGHCVPWRWAVAVVNPSGFRPNSNIHIIHRGPKDIETIWKHQISKFVQ